MLMLPLIFISDPSNSYGIISFMNHLVHKREIFIGIRNYKEKTKNDPYISIHAHAQTDMHTLTKQTYPR